MSMAEGFAQGFGMMNQYMSQKSAEERQAAADAENNRRYQEGIDYRSNRDTVADTRYNEQKAEQERLKNVELGLKGFKIGADAAPLEEQALGLYQTGVAKAEEDRKLDHDAKKAQIANSYSSMKSQQLNQKVLNNQLTDYDVQSGLHSLMSTGTVTPDQAEAFKKRLPDFIPSIAKRADAMKLYSDQFNTLNSQLEAETSPEIRKSLQEGILKFAQTDSPEARALFNTGFYQSYQDRMKANPDITSISHAGFADINGKLVPLMDITYKDGKSVSKVPATANKSGNDDDKIVALSPRQVIERAHQAVTLSASAKRMLDENPELASHYGVKAKPVQLGYGAQMVDPNTGEVISKNDRTSSGGSGAGYAYAPGIGLYNKATSEVAVPANKITAKDLKDIITNPMLDESSRSTAKQQLDSILSNSGKVTVGQSPQQTGMQSTADANNEKPDPLNWRK